MKLFPTVRHQVLLCLGTLRLDTAKICSLTQAVTASPQVSHVLPEDLPPLASTDGPHPSFLSFPGEMPALSGGRKLESVTYPEPLRIGNSISSRAGDFLGVSQCTRSSLPVLCIGLEGSWTLISGSYQQQIATNVTRVGPETSQPHSSHCSIPLSHAHPGAKSPPQEPREGQGLVSPSPQHKQRGSRESSAVSRQAPACSLPRGCRVSAAVLRKLHFLSLQHRQAPALSQREGPDSPRAVGLGQGAPPCPTTPPTAGLT